MTVSAISFGAWAIGGAWGDVDDKESLRALHAAIDTGVNFIDTADVYGDGRSERLVARLKQERPRDVIWVATKAGRRLPAQTPDGYSRENLTAWVERSLKNLGMDAVDLLQLHCPHPKVYDMPEVFGILDELVATGKLRHYGVSVETVDEAFRAIRHPHVASVQIIFNVFRQKPAESFFGAAKEHGIGILARVPLASGLLTGKLTRESTFAESDHRRFNREGQAFDRGETFSGVDFETGLLAAEELKELVPEGNTLAQFALRWILMHPAVSCAIPGGKNPSQVEDNVAAAEMPPLSDDVMQRVREIYDRRVREEVHHQW